MLTQDQIHAYRRDGVLLVPGVVTGEELHRLQQVAERVTHEAVAHGRVLHEQLGLIDLAEDHGFWEWQSVDDRLFLYARGNQGERVFRRAEAMLTRDPIFGLVSANPRVRAIVEAIVGDAVIPANDSLVVKMPGAGAAVPWHRDPSGRQLIDDFGDASSDFTCDIYIDPSTVENGCVWALPGSHLAGGPDLEEASLDFDVPGARPLEARPGDMLIHSTGVLHGSPTNTSGSVRRTLYFHYRTPAEIAGGYWQRPQEWVDERAAEFEGYAAARVTEGLDAALPA